MLQKKWLYLLLIVLFTNEAGLIAENNPANGFVYEDPEGRFTLGFLAGWIQGHASQNQQAYFSYCENGITLAEVIIYSYLLPHAMNENDLQAEIEENSFYRANTATPYLNDAIKDFGFFTAAISEYSYVAANQSHIRFLQYYFIHAYTGTGIVIRLSALEKSWPEMEKKFKEMMKNFKPAISHISLEPGGKNSYVNLVQSTPSLSLTQLAQQNLNSVQPPPILTNPERFMPQYPWKIPEVPTPYDKNLWNKTTAMKNIAKNDPSLQALVPILEQKEKEYEARVKMAEAQKQKAPPTQNTTTPTQTQGNELPSGSAITSVLTTQGPADFTGNIYGRMEATLPPQEKEALTRARNLGLEKWEDPLHRFSLLYPKDWTRNQKGEWYLSFDGPGSTQFLILALMDHQATIDFFQSSVKGRTPLERKECPLKRAHGTLKATLTTFPSKTEDSKVELIMTALLPEEGNLFFLISIPKLMYEDEKDKAMIQQLINAMIEGIELKG
ncbi:MAG: hypothetical protein HYS07_05300 [Chlamydiae bacterium]|nr:hypothetical protein [Chlamydiota bacterium]MBI3278003.1 hypothetical protein [Chlamydiota bacterium]